MADIKQITLPSGSTYDIVDQGARDLISALPAVNNGTLTMKINGTQKETFTANQSTNSTFNVLMADVLPAVDSTKNGYFLRVVNGAWAEAAVANAETNSF